MYPPFLPFCSQLVPFRTRQKSCLLSSPCGVRERAKLCNFWGSRSSGLWRRVARWIPTFRIIIMPSYSTLSNQRRQTWSLETSGNTSPKTQLTVTEDLKPQLYRCENPQARTETSEPADRRALLSCYCCPVQRHGITGRTDMSRLTTGIRSEECVVRRFRRCANVIQCTYTNPDSTV